MRRKDVNLVDVTVRAAQRCERQRREAIMARGLGALSGPQKPMHFCCPETYSWLISMLKMGAQMARGLRPDHISGNERRGNCLVCLSLAMP